MKNLDMDIASKYFRACDSCRVRLEFTRGYQKDKTQSSDVCKVTVPYSSFSKKLQTIQRLGGKIVGISILDSQLASSQIISTIVETEAIALEPKTPETIVETEAIALEPETPETIVETEAIALEPETPETIVETEAIALEPETPETIVETEAIASEKTSKKSTTKSKKPKAPAKTNHGFNKSLKITSETVADPIANTFLDEAVENLKQEPRAIAIVETVVETIPCEVIVEPAPEIVFEVSQEKVLEPIIAPLPTSEPKTEPQSKKVKTPTKSAQGFNKVKNETKTTKKTKG